MKQLKTLIAALLIMGTALSVTAQVEPVDKDKLAIGGYDPVAYFTANKATKGIKKYGATHNGITYYFASAGNRKAFKANPNKYLPQCDGYCAWGVSEKSSKFPINPETFKIVNGKLYLFFNGDFKGQPFNTLNEWNKDEGKQLANIDANWQKLKN
jgi:YHS domain-containing protein